MKKMIIAAGVAIAFISVASAGETLTYTVPIVKEGYSPTSNIKVTEWALKGSPNVRCVAITHPRGAGVTCFDVKKVNGDKK